MSVPQPVPAVVAVVLAAGGSTRLGRPKQLERLGGLTLVRRAALAACGAGAESVVVVLGAHADETAREVLGLPVRLVHNIEWSAGVGSSIRCGALAAGSSPAALLLTTCDQVRVGSAHLARMIEAFRRDRPLIVASGYAGARGVPALFSEALREELSSLHEAEGGKVVIERYPDRVLVLPLEGGELDVDTAGDLEAARADFERAEGPRIMSARWPAIFASTRGIWVGGALVAVCLGTAMRAVRADVPAPPTGDARQDFLEVAKVLLSPRCKNCHPAGEAPLQTEKGIPHAMNVSRKSVDAGLTCTACHRGSNAPMRGAPPGAPSWHMPSAAVPMVFEGKSPAELCAQLKDPAKTGGLTLEKLVHHVEQNPLVLWGWNPGQGRSLPPLSHAAFVNHTKRWVAGGAPCPP